MVRKSQKRSSKISKTRRKPNRTSKPKRKTTHTRGKAAQHASKARTPREQKRRPTTVQKGASHQAQSLMQAPASGVKVRMYRQGHGDCFLLAFPRPKGRPAYVLIDCGYKPGSNTPFGLPDISKIVASIHESTGGHLDLVIITHEHQDHVNAIPGNFEDFEVGEAWFAWTEDPDDEVANDLRKRHHDQLLGLVAAHNQLASSDSIQAQGAAKWLTHLLELEFGIDNPSEFAAAAKDPAKSINKQGMKLIKDKAGKKNTKYIRPHQEIMRILGVEGVRVFAFGPPRDPDLISDEDPEGNEAFPGHGISAFASFYAAARAAEGDTEQDTLTFSARLSVPLKEAFRHPECGKFFRDHYGHGKTLTAIGNESADDASWRRIDQDWLYSAEELALVLNKGINNTSLVLAFELPKTRKVLLFIGDAQRGNWISWTQGNWKEGQENITVKDLMSRTVLYKVGHHGSHNATLHGTEADAYPNLGWMGHGNYGNEFTAMITAVNKWALAVKPKPWVHPLPSIKKALMEKCAGRVFQIDTPQLTRPEEGISEAEWEDFRTRTTTDPSGLYFEYEVHDV
jgi:beta-lactamase superfamily II metal-dependent hydrolase